MNDNPKPGQDVALHPEGVDRNLDFGETVEEVFVVALHPEGVDRNNEALAYLGISNTVALHPEGVVRKQIVTLDFWT